jgi:signal transduction histidine kinase
MPPARFLCREVPHQRGIEISFEAEKVPDSLSKRITECVYRVLQESLLNAVKHSGTARIDVRLHCGIDQIELTIRDFGSGFHVERAKTLGLGLISMNERLKAVHGRLAIRSQPQNGTTMHASVPLVPDQPDTPKRPDSV